MRRPNGVALLVLAKPSPEQGRSWRVILDKSIRLASKSQEPAQRRRSGCARTHSAPQECRSQGRHSNVV